MEVIKDGRGYTRIGWVPFQQLVSSSEKTWTLRHRDASHLDRRSMCVQAAMHHGIQSTARRHGWLQTEVAFVQMSASRILRKQGLKTPCSLYLVIATLGNQQAGLILSIY